MKLQRPQNGVLRAIGNFDRRTPVHDFALGVQNSVHVGLHNQIMQETNPNVRAIGQGEARHRKYKRLKLGGGQAYGRSSV
jgi:hypothetical protein